jgi:hypothetical protein
MHTIRLRGPWQLEPIQRYVRCNDGRYERSTAPLLSVRAKMPADWTESLGDDFLGRVCYRRTFQKPTGLDRGERVWLVVEPPRSRCVVSFNDYVFGVVHYGSASRRFDITRYLNDHNRLDILVDHPALDEGGTAKDDSTSNMPGGLVGEVRLEIED